MALQPHRTYMAGPAIDYTSCYGYPKRRFNLLDTETGQTVGMFKEEVVKGAPGAPDIVVFYTKDYRIRKSPERCYYQTVEAMIVGLGGQVGQPKQQQPKLNKPAPLAIADKPAKFGDRDEMIEWYAATLGIKVKSLKSRMAKEGYGARSFTERDLKKVYKAELSATKAAV